MLTFPEQCHLEPEFTGCIISTVYKTPNDIFSDEGSIIQQGFIGDCYLIAALDYCTNTMGKGWWKELIFPLMNSACKVQLNDYHIFMNYKFPSYDNCPVGIDYNLCFWAALLEKAYLIYLHRKLKQPLKYTILDQGGYVENAIKVFFDSIESMKIYILTFTWSSLPDFQYPCFEYSMIPHCEESSWADNHCHNEKKCTYNIPSSQ